MLLQQLFKEDWVPLEDAEGSITKTREAIH